MNELIKINNQELSVKEFKGQRVVTFNDVDILHERVEGTAKRNFYENKFDVDGKTERFIEGEDYFLITSAQKNEFRTLEIPNRGLILITESGYLMLVKSFNDDLAWKVQRQLVNNYFRKQIINQNQSELITEMKAELEDEIKGLVKNGIDEVKQTCSEYYRPASVEKYNISSYIKKRLDIDKANDEYELVRQRVLIILGGGKWEDIPIEKLRSSIDTIDESINIIKGSRKLVQTDLFDSI